MLPIFINEYRNNTGREDLKSLIEHLVQVLGSLTVIQNIRTIILYVLNTDFIHCWIWVFERDERIKRFQNDITRNLSSRLAKIETEYVTPQHEKMRISLQRDLLIKYIDVLCFYGKKDEIHRVVQTPEHFIFNPKIYPKNIVECVCLLAAKYGQLDILKSYLVLNSDIQVQKKIAKKSFRTALLEGISEIYEFLYFCYDGIIDWSDSELDYEKALLGSYTLQGLTHSPLRFLLKHDPRTCHISQKYKVVLYYILEPGSQVKRFYRLKDSLNKDECVSSLHYANYDPKLDN